MRPTPPPWESGQQGPSNQFSTPGVDKQQTANGMPEQGKVKEPYDAELARFLNPTRSVINQYSKTLRSCDQTMLNSFRDLIVLGPDEEPHRVPIVWGPQEKAVAVALGNNVAQDMIRIDRIKLPIMALTGGECSFAPERFTYHKAFRWFKSNKTGNYFYGKEKRFGDTVFGEARGMPVDKNYTLHVWSLYTEEMNQLVEQIYLKFDPILTLYVPDVHWEVIAKITGASNGTSAEIGDSAMRIVKYEFNITAETYISRGVMRGKSVFDIFLKKDQEFFDNGDIYGEGIRASDPQLEDLEKYDENRNT